MGPPRAHAAARGDRAGRPGAARGLYPRCAEHYRCVCFARRGPPCGDLILGCTGIIMALHLFRRSGGTLRLLTAYEDGSVALREYTRGEAPSVEGAGWAALWSVRLHGESGA